MVISCLCYVFEQPTQLAPPEGHDREVTLGDDRVRGGAQ
jgi:hypothetical protein